jgi:hypothetical protein
MRMTRRQIATWLIGALLLLGAGTLAVIWVMRALDVPPTDAQSLAAILQSIERKGVGAIQSAEYERDWWRLSGDWQVTACKESCLKLYIDAKTGEERQRKSEDLDDEESPGNVQGAAALARSFEERKLGFITEMEFEHGAWQVKYREARGLSGALQPTKRRVFEPTQASLTRERRPSGGRNNLLRVSEATCCSAQLSDRLR